MLRAEEMISSIVYIWILVSRPAHPAVTWGPPIRLGVHRVPASHASLGAALPDHTPAAYKQPVCSYSSSFRQSVPHPLGYLVLCLGFSYSVFG